MVGPALRRRAGPLPRPGQLHRSLPPGPGAHDLDHPPAPDGDPPAVRPVPARVIRLADCTHREMRVLARDPRAVVLLPLGAIEQHGPHLPLSVDWLGAEEIARRIARPLARGGYRLVFAPSIPYGVSTLAIGWSGTVSLSPPTLGRLVTYIVGALGEHAFRRFVLANYQADPDHLRVIGQI